MSNSISQNAAVDHSHDHDTNESGLWGGVKNPSRRVMVNWWWYFLLSGCIYIFRISDCLWSFEIQYAYMAVAWSHVFRNPFPFSDGKGTFDICYVYDVCFDYQFSNDGAGAGEGHFWKIPGRCCLLDDLTILGGALLFSKLSKPGNGQPWLKAKM